MKLTFDQTISADVVIAGAGYAGIKSAYECSKAGLSVLLVVKSRVCSGSSFYPLMTGCGCLSPKDDSDKELFVEELCEVGLGINDKTMSETFVEDIASRVEELEGMGFPTSKLLGRKACFAKRDRDIFMWNEFASIKQNVRDNFSHTDNLRVMQNNEIVHIVSIENKVKGAISAGKDGKLTYIKTNNLILATGGFCGLYKNNTNTADTTGLGQAMAYDAGAKLINLEFVQILPCFVTPTYNALLPETSLLYAQQLQDATGREILSQYLPKGITPRQCIDSRSGHGPFTSVDYSKFFDIAAVKEIQRAGRQDACEIVFSSEILKSDNPAIQLQVKNMAKQNIDVTKDRLTIAPFGNSSNGGVLINKNAETNVEGLFAAGEVSGGLHGADRIGGLASGSCFVFGRRAALSAAKRKNEPQDYADQAQAMKQFCEILFSGNGSISPSQVMTEVNNIFDRYANVIRTQSGLQKGLDEITSLESSYSAGNAAETGENIGSAAAARHSLKTAQLVLTAMLERKESRGAHYREDFPSINDAEFNFRTVVSIDSGKPKTEHV